MKSKFNTVAPFLALILLGLAGSAYWKYGVPTQESAKLLASEEERARVELELAEIALAGVDALEAPAAGTQSSLEKKDVALANGVASVMQLARASNMKVASITGATVQGGRGSVAVDSLFASVPMTNGKLYVSDVLVRADYKEYDGFLRFFSGLTGMGVSVQALTIKNSSIEATLRFTGV